MSFIVGDEVIYNDLKGVVSFVSEESISILIKEGTHKSHDVKVVVYASDYKQVHYQDEK